MEFDAVPNKTKLGGKLASYIFALGATLKGAPLEN
jgi:hypothetical protein